MSTWPDLREQYSQYINALNTRKWETLKSYVADEVTHNSTTHTLSSYTSMLEGFAEAAPDQHYHIKDIVVDDKAQQIAVRLSISCTPRDTFVGYVPTGKKIEFEEYVFYWFKEGRIFKVASLLDEKALGEQMKGNGQP